MSWCCGGVAAERVVVAWGGCCSPLRLDPKAPFPFPFKTDGGGEGEGCAWLCVQVRVCASLGAWLCVVIEGSGFLKELDSTGVGEFPVAS